MKKSFLLSIVLSLIFTSTQSQIIIHSDDIAAIGYIAAQGIDETPDASITEGGFGNINWDFNALEAELLDTFFFLDPAATPYMDSFPTSNLASKIDSELHAYMIKDQDKIEVIGIGGTRDLLGLAIEGALYVNPGQSLIRFPATYGDTYQETVVQTGQVTGAQLGLPTVDSVRLIDTVIRSVEIDAYGMMTIQSGTYETLRSTETEISLADVYTLNNGAWQYEYSLSPDTLISYNWWTLENGSAFPVVQMEYDPTDDIRTVTWLRNLTNTENLFNKGASLFPNPACDYVNLDLPEPFYGTAVLVNVNGKQVANEQITGQSSLQVRLSNINSGVYVVVLRNEEGKMVGHKKINIFR